MYFKPLRVTAALALVLALAAPVAAAAPTEPNTPAPTTFSALKGEARMEYPVDTEEVRFSVDAHSVYGAGNRPERSWGTFRLSHSYQRPDGTTKVLWGDFKVDCLTTGGPTATVTGTLVRTSPGHPWTGRVHPHFRQGVSFLVPEGGGQARIGLSGATGPDEPRTTPCMAPAADSPVFDGTYTLKDRSPGARRM
ncbi:hypothetical protein [Streptomyces sp. NPDC058989]|uniref:hypothetical protein n=1 Tax=Streptomyces sp. NPDC058989 TaxID=3346686 RepID=UPI0036A4EDD0